MTDSDNMKTLDSPFEAYMKGRLAAAGNAAAENPYDIESAEYAAFEEGVKVERRRVD